MSDRQLAGVFSLIWGLALMSATGLIYVKSGVFYRVETLPYQLEVFIVLYLIFGLMFHFSMIADCRNKWLNVTAAAKSFLFFIFFHAYPIQRSAQAKYLLIIPFVFWVVAWLVVSIADYRDIFDDKK
jgi:hypothetical protein